MKAGILYSDHITTVSRQYAKEIRTPEYGYGLDGLLRVQSNLTGILNGIDYSIWNPEVDSLIPSKYSPSNLRGKEKCKAALQKRFDLQPKTNTPIIGMISRLADQKGFDLIAESIDDLMKLDVQLVILGAGDPKYHELLTQVSKRYPHRTGITLGFDNALAHCIEAGSDMFLMPSLYEPCGLNQLYSLKYGTIPIVRKTGGLSDSITNASPSTIQSGTGTGFVFEEYIGKRMLDALTRAIKLYKANPRAWAKLVQNAMSRDFSWDVSAREYQKLYRKVAD